MEIIDQLKDLSILISRHCPPASSQELKSLHKREVDLIDQLRGSIVRTRSVNMESTFEFLQTLSEKMGASMNKDIVLEMTGDRIEIDERNEMGLMMVLSHLLKYIVEEGKVIRGDRKFSNKAGGRICVSVFMIGHRAAISIEHRFHRINPCGQRNKPGDEADPLNASRSIVGRDRGNQYSRDVPSRDENYNPSLLADLIIVENMVKKLGWTLEAENSSGEGLGFLLMLQANPGTIPVMVVDINNVSYAMDLNYVHWGVRVTRDEVEGDIFRWRGADLPMIDLTSIMGQKVPDMDRYVPGLVMGQGDWKCCFLVSSLVGVQDFSPYLKEENEVLDHNIRAKGLLSSGLKVEMIDPYSFM
ncbi:MAG: hypothetical protein E4H30_02630 [Methanomassiliicoccus sp.]|nr:MAG: hypothetical protein E4H30_02630 [Methanomassiliicoccus sp.]